MFDSAHLASIIERQQAEIVRLREGRDTMGTLWAKEKGARHVAEAEIERLSAICNGTIWEENQRLRAALKMIQDVADGSAREIAADALKGKR